MESASSRQEFNLSDLPIGALSHMSSYLTLPSRALLAVALNCHGDTDSSSAIVGDQQDALDFGDIEKELAAKLTDDDVKGVLLSIDAINNLKTLRLTNLLNITGIGLEPLRGSTMIEKIDLSLVGDNESPDLSHIPPISCTEVLPILNSVIDMGEASSLKLLIFPKEWRKGRNTESGFHVFLVRYNELLRTREVTCLKCHDYLTDNNNSISHIALIVGRLYGTQDGTCYDCLKHYCLECEVDEDGENVYCMSLLCGICNRHYCLNCIRASYCGSCNESYCVDCIDTKQCANCEEITCLNCISERKCRNDCCDGKIWCNTCDEDGDALKHCDNCDTDYCIPCSDANTDAKHSIDFCVGCRESLCGKCRLIKCKDGSGCTRCYRYAFPALLEEKERQIQEMQAEIDKQRNEINQFKRKVEDMSGKLEDNE